MKSCSYGRTAYVLMFMVLYCLVCSFTLIEARDLRADVVGRRGIGLTISTPESKSCEDIICQQKVGSLKLQLTAAIRSRKVYGFPAGKFAVQVVGRSALVYPMDHSPGIGHAVPPGFRH